MQLVKGCSVPRLYPITPANVRLMNAERVWTRVYHAGGPAAYTNPDYEYAGSPPWRDMPANGERFQRRGVAPLPAAENVEVNVITYTVPAGWEGVLLTVTNVFNSVGFLEGSGDLIWRVKFDWQWFKDLDAVQISLGRLDNPYALEGGGYRLFENQTLTYNFLVGTGGLANLDPKGMVICAMSGWLYPKY